SQAAGGYTATLAGTLAGDPVQQQVTVTVTGAPVYASLDELKHARRIKPDDTTDDTALMLALSRASRAIDKKTGRRFWLDEVATTRVFFPHGRVLHFGPRGGRGQLLLVDDIGTEAGLVVEAGSPAAGWTQIDDWVPQPDNALVHARAIDALARPLTCWSLDGFTRVRITARWGWPELPEDVSQATVLLANRRYLRKDSPQGVLTSAEWGGVRVSKWDPDVMDLIEPYMHPGVGG
ncbi:hypothetical protein K1W54_28745, partial [Micromonospora sp. CPCC 205371]|nr:hypothetical protein [Micromonospora sp. CPCC 205371]